MFKNVSGQKFRVFAFDSATGLPKTGDAANLTGYVSKDYGTVTVLGDTSATEEDATNAKGYYLFDATQAETNADVLMVSGKSSTSGVVVVGAPAVIATYPTTGILAPATAGRTLVVDAAGLADANAVKVGPSGSGMAQTARDIGASVLLSSGTGTGQISLSSGAVLLQATQTGVTIPTVTTVTSQLTAAQIATGVWQDTTAGDFTTPLSVGKSLMNGVSLGTGLTVARCTLTDTLTTYTGNTVQTGDAYARLGAPAGASVSADVAAVKSDSAAILDDTGTFGVVLSSATCNKIADHGRRRTQAAVELSSDGDALSLGSLYGFIQMAQESNTVDTPNFITVYRTDGTTSLGTKAVSTDPAAEPITSVS